MPFHTTSMRNSLESYYPAKIQSKEKIDIEALVKLDIQIGPQRSVYC